MKNETVTNERVHSRVKGGYDRMGSIEYQLAHSFDAELEARGYGADDIERAHRAVWFMRDWRLPRLLSPQSTMLYDECTATLLLYMFGASEFFEEPGGGGE